MAKIDPDARLIGWWRRPTGEWVPNKGKTYSEYVAWRRLVTGTAAYAFESRRVRGYYLWVVICREREQGGNLLKVYPDFDIADVAMKLRSSNGE